MGSIGKQRHGALSALRRIFGTPSIPPDRAPQSGEGFTRWLREFEMQNRAETGQTGEDFTSDRRGLTLSRRPHTSAQGPSGR
jgi:hypothetical protein